MAQYLSTLLMISLDQVQSGVLVHGAKERIEGMANGS